MLNKDFNQSINLNNFGKGVSQMNLSQVQRKGKNPMSKKIVNMNSQALKKRPINVLNFYPGISTVLIVLAVKQELMVLFKKFLGNF